MSDKTGPLLLKGTRGVLKDEKYVLDCGKVCIIGRSRESDFSVRRSMKYLLLSPEERQERDHFNSVSRKHCSIAYHSANSLEIEDFSRHGTFVNGKRIHRVILSDFQSKSYEITVGTEESFVIECPKTSK